MQETSAGESSPPSRATLASASSSGLLRCRLELGEPDTPCGEPYKVMLLATRRGLNPGRMSELPADADARSDSIQIHR